MIEEKVDGRRERTKRTRGAIVSALTELLDEGRIEPTAAEIAERAGVAVRSIGQHFGSREELLVAVAEHHAARVRVWSAEPIAATEPFEERLARFVADRGRALEASRAMRNAAGVVAGRSPAVTRAIERVAKDRRAETAAVFAPEIAKTADSPAAGRAVALATSGRAWDALRVELALGPKAAREQMAYLIRAALR